MEKFFTKIKSKSVDAVEFSDLERIKKYQHGLINQMVYHTGRQQTELREKFLNEIKKTERWLKSNFSSFMNDHNRKINS